MRFLELFMSYKIGLQGIKSTIPFTELPLYRQVCMTVFLVGLIMTGILYVYIHNLFTLIPSIISVLSVIIFAIIDSRKTNLNYMLKNYYIPYSNQRIQMTIEVLREYNIDFNNVESLNMLIEEAKYAQTECDIFAKFQKPLKTLTAIIVPIAVLTVQKVSEAATPTQMLYMGALVIITILLIFSLIFSFMPIVKNLLYRDYYKYNELMYDLRQIKLFYARKSN
ncbi:hypothetical protein [Fannyhessea vaginae]|uniref:Uncharacterized protein n=2 Tax=Fannyhessea vaginae TaxID=82135 RepID=F1T4F4_9ACTN|nr:hypothetical protein [Fannyhessea vaginae]EGF23598.1 hypothetical protein HMPREF0091_10545 [Fannyhessea vaginae DSM 15829]SSZ04949.1 Uncharacterised protein [Fannyhessea vaginae]